MRYLFLASAAMFAAAAQTADKPARGAVTDPGVITTRQSITPAGIPTIFKGKVFAVGFGNSASDLWVATTGQLYHMDWRENRIHAAITHRGLPGFLGVAPLPGGRTLFAMAPSATRDAALYEAREKSTELTAITGTLGRHNAGGIAAAGNTALVPLPFNNKVAIVDIAANKVRGEIVTSLVPFAAVINRAGDVAYVSNWGGRKPTSNDLTAPTGLDPKADRVVVDKNGIASTGAITRLDLKTMQATHTIPAGLHPNGLAWDEKANRLYVANNNRDSITVIDTNLNRITQTIELKPFAKLAPGVAPTAVALNSSGSKLYVACGGINAVIVIDTRTLRQEGMIPAGWYPNAVAISPDDKYLAIGALLGAGSGAQNDHTLRYVHANRGSVNVVEIPDAAQLARYTLAVSENNRLPLAGSAIAQAPAIPVKTPKAVPNQPADASLIEHVVYIVKENRTYDQLFGDLEKGNGEPAFIMFGENVTPNQRKLAREFVLLDNFYASGGNSADGHQWLTQSNEVAYTMWPAYQGRSYPFDGTDPLGIAQGGTIWDAALARKRTVRIYGEYAGRLAEPAMQRHEHLQAWKRGEDYSAKFNITAPIASMNAILAKHYPAYTNAVPDVIRAQIFLKDIDKWNRGVEKMPNLTVVQLPCDHTYGTTPSASSPKAMVADNDLAVGLIVEALSKSKYWPKMAIFIVEDDAQNGVDHVDGHRTVALAVSPYIRRGHVDSTFYSNQSMVKTIELMLGLPPLSLFDLIANDMRASFTDTPDLKPFDHVVPKQDLFERNPETSALKGEGRRNALASAKMRWDIPDAAPTERLNRILWRAVKGPAVPYPRVKQAVFAPYSLDIDDDDRDER